MSTPDRPPTLTPPSGQPLPPPPFSQPGSMDYDAEIYRSQDMREYLHVLWKRKWWIISTSLIIFLAATFYTVTRTPIFRAVTILQITQDNPGSQVTVDDKISKLTGTDSLEKFQQTQYKILQSESLAQRVIKALNLEQHPDFKDIREKHPDKTDSAVESDLIAAFLTKLQVSPVRNSYLVEMSFQSPDKAMAQKVINAIADEYMYLSIDRRNESFALVRRWLDQQLKEMAAKVEEAQKKLYKFGQQTDIYTLDDKDNVVVQKFIDLGSLLTKAQAEKMAKEAQFEQIQEKGPNAPLIVNHPLMAQLRQQAVSQRAKVSALQRVFRGEHPELLAEKANLAELQGRLQGEVQRLQESVKADYEAAQRTEKLLSDSFAEQKEQMARLQENLTNFQILKRDAQTNEQLYQALLARVKEANIASTMVPSNVTVIDPGRLPEKPFKPKTLRDLALAAVLGLTLGVGLAFLVEHLDGSIKSIDDVERYCGLPSLGIVPLLGGNGKKSLKIAKAYKKSGFLRSFSGLRRARGNGGASAMDLVVYEQPQSMVSEAIRHVYSSIMLSASGRPPAAILVTSPNPGEGKSTLVSNLAQSYALNDRQVVMIDCDLRKPKLHKIWQLEAQPGLSDYLTGSAALEEILRPTAIPNLSVITAGAKPPNPTNLINSDTFKELLQDLRQRFHHIIIDTPPVLGFADARFLSALVDGTLLVARHNVTHRSAARMACQLLNQTHILGAVLNGVGHYGHAYGGYYFHNHHKYYANYYENQESA